MFLDAKLLEIKGFIFIITDTDINNNQVVGVHIFLTYTEIAHYCTPQTTIHTKNTYTDRENTSL